jgi:hypothetical protein
MWTGLTWHWKGTRWGCYENGDKPSDFIKGGRFLDWLSDCCFLKKECALRSQIINYFCIKICISYTFWGISSENNVKLVNQFVV